MKDSSLIEQYENFRSYMVAAINNLEIDERQKQIFMMSMQAFYLQMLQQLPNNPQKNSGEIIYPDFVD